MPVPAVALTDALLHAPPVSHANARDAVLRDVVQTDVKVSACVVLHHAAVPVPVVLHACALLGRPPVPLADVRDKVLLSAVRLDVEMVVLEALHSGVPFDTLLVQHSPCHTTPRCRCPSRC